LCFTCYQGESEWLMLNAKWAIIQLLSWREQATLDEMMTADVHFVLDQHA
jgi:hypothetical protein